MCLTSSRTLSRDYWCMRKRIRYKKRIYRPVASTQEQGKNWGCWCEEIWSSWKSQKWRSVLNNLIFKQLPGFMILKWISFPRFRGQIHYRASSWAGFCIFCNQLRSFLNSHDICILRTSKKSGSAKEIAGEKDTVLARHQGEFSYDAFQEMQFLD